MSFLNVVQFVQLPFVVIPLLRFVMKESIMKERTYKKNYVILICVLSFGLQLINIYSIHGALKESTTYAYTWLVLIVIVQLVLMVILARVKMLHETVVDNSESEAILTM